MMRKLRLFNLLCVFVVLAACTKMSCQHEEAISAPEDMTGKHLHGQIDKAEGSLADAVGSEFVAIFDDPVHFHIQTPAGSVETSGTYQYKLIDTTSSTLTLTPESGDGKGMVMMIDLTWSNNSQGSFKSHITQGDKGHESGLFSLE